MIKAELLTEREWQILRLLAEGKLNKEISASLNISLDTVKKHLKNTYRKINARNRIEAVNYFTVCQSQTIDHSIIT
ncbi:MAG: LuxR C-terminal-related transcriptional regulator [Bacteroidota bacterium]